jgi:CRP-like cAMP-binding protein
MNDIEPWRMNAILGTLERGTLGEVVASGSPRQMQHGATLIDSAQSAKGVYFPRSGMASVLVTLEDGSTVECDSVGAEGLVGGVGFNGSTVLLSAVVQIEGEALLVEESHFKQLLVEHGDFRERVYDAAGRQVARVCMAVACLAHHHVDARLAKLLLKASDHVAGDVIEATQEDLALRLGAHRPTITGAAMDLQRRGLIRYRRGRIAIVDRAGLERASCECYHAMREMLRRSGMHIAYA